MPFLFLILTLFISSFSALAQDDRQVVPADNVYEEKIKSVKFHLEGLPLSYPVIELRSGSQLLLSFDDLDQEVDSKNYTYTLIHCDADWTPSDLSEMEYLDGFSEDLIRDFDFSFNTRTLYTHYRLTLPNRNVNWTKSGNYLLMVYEDEEEKRLVITRRFMVVEPVFKVDTRLTNTAMVGKSRTHQEIDFTVFHQGIDIRNPMLEVRATVLQNGRWDNAKVNLKPKFLRSDNLLFDYQDEIVFPAGKEFRFLDIRSMEVMVDKIADIRRYPDRWEVTVMRERSRRRAPYLFEADINGNFIIETRDRNNNNNALESEYANVFFTLDVNEPLFDRDVYLFGGMTDWKLKPEYKMVYNDINTSYVGRVLLKQGFYNYTYVAVDPDNEIDEELLEGNWFEAENEYIILVYYRPFGQRYDRLVAARTISSNG
jgi:hypothetical protein